MSLIGELEDRMNQEDVNYLCATLVGEARGECIEGQIAVANVIRNRVLAAGKSYKEICLAPKQFSCWNEGDPNFVLIRNMLAKLETGEDISEPVVRQCLAIARDVVAGDFIDNVNGAQNYVTLSRYQLAKARSAGLDAWMLRLKISVTVGNHCFLVEPDRKLKKV